MTVSDRYLPLGSVVLLREGRKTIMIYGRRQRHVQSGRVFDYVACLYPEGNVSDEHTYLFDHADIEEVMSVGYRDVQESEFQATLRGLDSESAHS